MENFFSLNYKIIKNGNRKGQLNTRKKKIKFIGRTILTYKYSKEIVDYIIDHEYLKNEIFGYPILVSKIHRPYLHKNLKTSDKAKSILESYNFIDNYFSKEIKKELYKTGSYELCQIIGKDESIFKVYLCLYPRFDKEGELNIKVVDENNEEISIITFGICDGDIFIGGLQGARRDLDQEYIKNATKKLHGLFPKKIAIEALYALKKSLKLNNDILATGNEMHVYKAQRYIRKRIISSSYNEFWESLNGINCNGLWVLPKVLIRKNIEDIPSKKRGQALKKYNILDMMYSNIEEIM